MKISKGQPFPLGIVIDKNGVNFAVEVSSGAVCRLFLYKRGNETPAYEYNMEERGNLSGIRFLRVDDWDAEIDSYVYSVDEEMVVDPYAKCIFGRSVWGQEEAKQISASIAAEAWEWNEEDSLSIPTEDVIAYRLHVRGFTKHNASKAKHKGTFQGLVEKLPYFMEIGINQVQLLPSHEFIEEGMKLNYWGYAPGYYMAPKSAYSTSEDVVREFANFVDLFHEHGIEVILDMPFIGADSQIYQLECLKYYVLRFHVDGFVLNPYVSNIDEIKRNHLFEQVKIILPEEGFQNTMRRFLKGDEDMVKEVIWRLKETSARENHLVYNHITNHNGFTLEDLVSYDGRHNELNGEKNQDGPQYNYCWNCGVEGATRKKPVLELRQRQVRNAWMLLLLAQGTPCILAGDEFGNSQKGNNNAYCQDNEISWINWRQLAKNTTLFSFVKELIAFRKSHKVFHQDAPLKGMDNMACGMPDVSYHGTQAWQVPSEVASRQLGVMYCGQYTGEHDYFVAYNMHWMEHDFALPALRKGQKWYPIIDSATGEFYQGEVLENQRIVTVLERSIVVFEGR